MRSIHSILRKRTRKGAGRKLAYSIPDTYRAGATPLQIFQILHGCTIVPSIFHQLDGRRRKKSLDRAVREKSRRKLPYEYVLHFEGESHAVKGERARMGGASVRLLVPVSKEADPARRTSRLGAADQAALRRGLLP